MYFKDWLITEKRTEKKAQQLFAKDWDQKQQQSLGKKWTTEDRPIDVGKDFQGKQCFFDAFTRDQQAIGKFARQSPENMAQVAMFSPLSARTLFANLEQQFPVVVYLLRYLYGHDKPVDKKELEQVLKDYFDKEGANTRSVVFGFKLDTVADIWNRRNRIYQQAMSMYNEADPSKSDTEGLMKLFSGLNKEVGNIAGIAPVKAGFVVQLLFGQAGCIDVHNVRIYKQLADKMGWGQPEAGKRSLSSQDIDIDQWAKKGTTAATEKGLQRYLDVLDRLKERGIGTKELWNIWVDFVGQIYRAAKLVNPDEPALNPLDPQYKDFAGTVIKSKAPAWMLGGQGRKETDVALPIASGTPEGGEISKWHRKAASEPEELLRQSNIGKRYPGLKELPTAKNPKDVLDRMAAYKRQQGRMF